MRLMIADHKSPALLRIGLRIDDRFVSEHS